MGSTEEERISGDTSWAELERVLSGSGSRTLKWCYEKNINNTEGEDRGWVDKLEFGGRVDSAEALDTAQTLTDSAGNDADWFGQTITYNSGDGNDDAIQSGALEHDQTSCFETTVTAPQRVSFHWKVSSQSGGDYLSFYVDDVQERQISGDVDWTELEHVLTGSAAHALKWCYEKDASATDGLDAAWVDKFNVFGLVESDLALDTMQTITNSAMNNADWYGQTTTFFNDSLGNDDALQSGQIGNNEDSCFETEVTAPPPMEVKFYWRVSSEDGDDYLRFYVNNTRVRQISGTVDWTQVSYGLTDSTTHTLKWCYEKNGSGSDGADRAWVDKLEFVNIVDSDEALDIPGRTIRGLPTDSADWYGQTTTYYNDMAANDDALQSGLIQHSQNSCFRVNGIAPGIVRFYWKVDSESGGDYLNFYTGAAERGSISGNVDWTFSEYRFNGSGNTDLRWCYEKNSSITVGADRGWVDKLEVIRVVPSDEALDIDGTGQTITNSAGDDANWLGKTDSYYDVDSNNDALESGDIEDDERSCFEGEAQAPARIRFFWKADSELNADYLRFYIDDVEQEAISGDTDWRLSGHTLSGSAAHTLKWCYEKNASGANGEDKGWVDLLELAGIVDSATALDTAQSITNSSANSIDWFGRNGIGNSDALENGVMGDSESSCFETMATAPIRVNFYWKVSSQDGADHLKFYVDDAEKESISGDVDWTEIEHLLIGSITHNLKWCYEKDSSMASGTDRGWVDRLEISDARSSADALDTSQTITDTDSSGSDANWFGQALQYYPSGSNNDSLQSGAITHDQKSCFETGVMAPVRVNFYWSVDSQPNADYLKFYVDDIEKGALSGNVYWTQIEHSLTDSAAHTLKWCYEKDDSGANGEDRAWVDQLEINSITVVSEAEALDDSSLSLTNPSTDPLNGASTEAWYGQNENSQNNGDALQSASVIDNGKSCFHTDLSVPSVRRANISFYWKVSSQPGFDYLNFYVNNVQIRQISGEVDWKLVEYTLGESGVSYELKWCYEKDASITAASDSGWVDWFRSSSVTVITPEEAWDDPSQTVMNSVGSDANWFGQNALGQSDGDALQSGLVGDSETSCFETSLTGPKNISFYWKVSSQEYGDYLRFYVDDIQKEEISGDRDWSEFRYTLEDSNAHTLKWCYEKNASLSQGQDSAWVDAFTSEDPIDGKEALDAPAANINISYPASYPAPVATDPPIPNARWIGEGNTSYNDNDVMRNGSIANGEISCFEAEISQVPAMGSRYQISFYWQVAGRENLDFLKFYIDGIEKDSIGGLTGPSEAIHFLEADTTAVLKWCYEKDASADTSNTEDRAWVDQLGLSENPVLSLAEALDNTILSFTNPASLPPGNIAWFGQGANYYNEGSNDDALQSGTLADSESSCFESSVTGPGSIEFYWKVSSQLGGDALVLYENNTEQARISGEEDWQAFEHVIEESAVRTLKWCYEKDASIQAGEDKAYVDLLKYNADNPAEALDLTGALSSSNFLSPASLPTNNRAWFGQRTNYKLNISGNEDALQSAGIADGQSSCFQVTVNVAATTWTQVQFYWKVSSEPNADALVFYLDEAERERISGDVDWSSLSHTLYNSSTSDQDHVLKWCYEKNASLSAGLDRAWVDALSIAASGAAITAETALDTSNTINASPADQADWFGQTTTYRNEGTTDDALESGSINDNQETCFETDITGPRSVIFYWKVDSQPNGDYLRFYEYDSNSVPPDPIPVAEISGNVDWNRIEHVVLASGARTLKWCYEKNGSWSVGSDKAHVDNLSITAPLGLEEALDTTASVTTPTALPVNNLAWFGQTTESSDDIDALQSGMAGDDQSSCFALNVLGSRDLGFYWKADSQSGADMLRLYVDDSPVREISGNVGWTQVTFTLGPKTDPLGAALEYELKWCYEKDASGASGQDRGWVDRFRTYNADGSAGGGHTISYVDPETALALPEAPILSGDAEWFALQAGDPGFLINTTAQSGLIGHNQSSCLATDMDITSPSKVEFRWRVSSEENADYLKFYVDSDANDGTDNYLEVRSISGSVGPAGVQVEHILPNSGSYRLRWCYEKNGSGAAGSDYGALVGNISGTDPEYFLTVTALSTVTEVQALDLPAMPPPL